jgi:hypothetical protein
VTVQRFYVPEDGDTHITTAMLCTLTGRDPADWAAHIVLFIPAVPGGITDIITSLEPLPLIAVFSSAAAQLAASVAMGGPDEPADH